MSHSKGSFDDYTRQQTKDLKMNGYIFRKGDKIRRNQTGSIGSTTAYKNRVYTVKCPIGDTHITLLEHPNVCWNAVFFTLEPEMVGIKSGLAISLETSCDHQFKLYTGFIDSFEYCTKCDHKKV